MILAIANRIISIASQHSGWANHADLLEINGNWQISLPIAIRQNEVIETRWTLDHIPRSRIVLSIATETADGFASIQQPITLNTPSAITPALINTALDRIITEAQP